MLPELFGVAWLWRPGLPGVLGLLGDLELELGLGMLLLCSAKPVWLLLRLRPCLLKAKFRTVLFRCPAGGELLPSVVDADFSLSFSLSLVSLCLFVVSLWCNVGCGGDPSVVVKILGLRSFVANEDAVGIDNDFPT